MALHLILGNSGSGKSHYLYEKILAEAKLHPDRSFFVIVPEQFSMATQREFVRRQERHAILNIDVLSFRRLAYRVFEELGKDSLRILEDTGKNLILQKLAGRLEGQMQVLGGSLHRTGCINEIKSFLTELSQYRVLPETLEDMAGSDGASPLLRAKLSDIRILYEAFLREIEGDYLLAEEMEEYMAELVPASSLFANAVLVFDGFTGFTPVQQDFLREVFPAVIDIYAAFTIGAEEDFYRGWDDAEQLFYLSKKTIHTLLVIAKDTGVAVADPAVLSDGARRRFANSPLLYHLEQNMFRLGQRPYAGESEWGRQTQLRVAGFARPLDELRFAAREIKRLAREGMRYRDVAIVSGDARLYASYVPQVFAEYDIPYFLDQSDPILFHPLIECARSLLELAKRDFSYEAAMRLVKTGLLPIGSGLADILDNYLLATGIRGHRRWGELWTYCPGWMDADGLAELNEARGRLMQTLGPYMDIMTDKSSTVLMRTRALYDVMAAFDMEPDDPGDARIWRAAMDLFDKLAALLGGEILPLDEYADIVDAGFEAAKAPAIPPGLDQVIVGDIERTRLENVKVLFFLGVNDGVIPSVSGEGGILSQLERETLARAHYELAPTARERAFIQRFYLYMNMTKPSFGLYLTYARTGADGASMRRSYLIGMILRMFPGLKAEDYMENDAEISAMDFMATPAAAFRYLAEGMERAKAGEAPPEWGALLAWFGARAQWREPLERLLSAAYFRMDKAPLSAETGRLLYGSVIENSVTRLERFAACAYAHFLAYGLRLRERDTHDFEPVDFGNVLHAALEHYANGLERGGYDWFDVPEEERLRLAEAAMRFAMAQAGDALFSSAKNRYLSRRMQDLLHKTVDTLTRQVRKGRFRPAEYELSFGAADGLRTARFALAGGGEMHLMGRIDRVDVLELGGDTYIKVIDYKSGQTKFSLSSLYHGLQLQLAVYLDAAMELIGRGREGDILPAGIFYYHVDDPVVDADPGADEEEIRRAAFEKLRMDGIVNADPDIYGAMDAEFTDKSDVIPVARTKSGELSSASKAYTTAQFGEISNYVNYLVRRLGQRMMDGEIAINPYELGGKNACQWCVFRSICGFDERLEGCGYRRLERFDSDGAVFEEMERIEKEQEEGGEDGDGMDDAAAAGH